MATEQYNCGISNDTPNLSDIISGSSSWMEVKGKPKGKDFISDQGFSLVIL